MEESSKIIMRRRGEFMNRMRGYRVFVDDVKMGIIKNGSTEEYIVSPGLHQVNCKVDWCSSPKKEIMLKPGEIAYLEVRSNLRFFIYLYIILLAGLFGRIALRSGDIILPEWVKFVYGGLAGIAAIYILYFLTLGRNKYLAVEDDKNSVFSK